MFSLLRNGAWRAMAGSQRQFKLILAPDGRSSDQAKIGFIGQRRSPILSAVMDILAVDERLALQLPRFEVHAAALRYQRFSGACTRDISSPRRRLPEAAGGFPFAWFLLLLFEVLPCRRPAACRLSTRGGRWRFDPRFSSEALSAPKYCSTSAGKAGEDRRFQFEITFLLSWKIVFFC